MDVSLVLAVALLLGDRADLGAARDKRGDPLRNIRASPSLNDDRQVWAPVPPKPELWRSG